MVRQTVSPSAAGGIDRYQHTVETITLVYYPALSRKINIF